jgi:hypothetical protein
MAAIKDHDEGLADRLAKVQDENADALKADPLAYDCSPTDPDVDTADDTKVTFACLAENDQLRLGEILFNLNSIASGAYSCARCHVPGFSFGQPGESIDEIARGRYGPNLVGIEKDMTPKQHFSLIMQGTKQGQIYGANHQGDGRMPGFGINPNQGDLTVPQLGAGGMYTPEEVWAIMTYERNLTVQQQQSELGEAVPVADAGPLQPGARPSTTTTTSEGIG